MSEYEETELETPQPNNNRTKILAGVTVVALIAAALYWGLSKPAKPAPVYKTPTFVMDEPEPTIVPETAPEPVVDTKTQEETTEETTIQEITIADPAAAPDVSMEESQAPALVFPLSYTAKKGDTLTDIGLKLYEDTISWPLIFQSNAPRLPNPDRVKSGLELNIPERVLGTTLYSAYYLTYESYLSADKFSKAFWTLCSGAKSLDKKFISYLKENLDEADFALVERCRRR